MCTLNVNPSATCTHKMQRYICIHAQTNITICICRDQNNQKNKAKPSYNVNLHLQKKYSLRLPCQIVIKSPGKETCIKARNWQSTALPKPLLFFNVIFIIFDMPEQSVELDKTANSSSYLTVSHLHDKVGI